MTDTTEFSAASNRNDNGLVTQTSRLLANVQRFTDKLVGQIQRVNLTKPRKYALVGRIIAAVGLDVSKLSAMMSIIKRDMKKKLEVF